MQGLALSVIILLSITGCTGRVGPVSVTMGESSIETTCDSEGTCVTKAKSGPMSEGFAGMLGKLLDAVVSRLPGV